MAPNLDRKVARGAKRLDRYHPGWWRKIDVAELEMADGEHCILGQCYVGGDGYLQGLSALEIPMNKRGIREDEQFGFDVRLTGDESYAELRDAWVRYLKARYVAEAGRMK